MYRPTSHDVTMLILALDTAILEATKAVAQTAADALEYKGYVFALSEFNRLRLELEDEHDLYKLRNFERPDQ